METKERIYIRKGFNFHRAGLEHQHGRRFIVLEQYGRRDVMWKRSIASSPGELLCATLRALCEIQGGCAAKILQIDHI